MPVFSLIIITELEIELSVELRSNFVDVVRFETNFLNLVDQLNRTTLRNKTNEAGTILNRIVVRDDGCAGSNTNNAQYDRGAKRRETINTFQDMLCREQ